MNRKPIFAGQFYPKKFEELDRVIKKSFLGSLGPSELPIKNRKRDILGIIAPHAGYQFSGSCAAWAYKELGEGKFPEVYIILGPNHSGIGSDFSTCLFSNWETPFGEVKIHEEFGKKLMTKFRGLKNELEPEFSEHSIEVQLPFLQYVNRDKLEEIKFIPILIKSSNYEELCKLADAIADTDLRISVICSSDFTHFGPDYGFKPFAFSKKDNLYKLD